MTAPPGTSRRTGAGAASPTAPGGGYGSGTAPVFLASISTILGAIIFLRFGHAVGNAGLVGALAIIVVGHVVTIPTALAPAMAAAMGAMMVSGWGVDACGMGMGCAGVGAQHHDPWSGRHRV
jgi:hypothetical protein